MHRYVQYLEERFPIEQFLPLSLVFAAAAGMGAQSYANSGRIRLLPLAVAAAALFLFLLRLRFFDEFKDFEHDRKYYKDRPVSRGLVALKEISRATYVVCALECLIAFVSGTASIALFVASFLYSLLMFKEFFLRDWIRRHFTVYFISHELLIFPLFLYLMSLNGMPAAGLRQSGFWLLAAFAGFNLFLLEITRKMRPRAEEIESHDTYSAQYGIAGSAILAFAVAAVVLVLAHYAEYVAGSGGRWTEVFRFVAFTFFSYTLLLFVRRADRGSARKMFFASIAFSFVSLAVFLVKCVRDFQ